MNKKLNLWAIQGIALILWTSSLFSQEEATDTNPFEVFKEYKQWGLSLSPRLYAKAKTKVTNGIYDIDTKNSFGLGVGLDYVFYPSKRWSFRTGARINFFSPENFNVSIPSEELTPFSNQPINQDFRDFSILFSAPIEVEWKHALSNKRFFSVRTGLEFFIYETFEASSGLLVDPNNANSNEMFFILNKSSKNSIHPYFKFSPSVYFIFNPFMLQTSVVYQKNLNTLEEGVFRFSNLAETNSGSGTYEVSGDFVGLELTFFLKKNPKNKKK